MFFRPENWAYLQDIHLCSYRVIHQCSKWYLCCKLYGDLKMSDICPHYVSHYTKRLQECTTKPAQVAECVIWYSEEWRGKNGLTVVSKNHSIHVILCHIIAFLLALQCCKFWNLLSTLLHIFSSRRTILPPELAQVWFLWRRHQAFLMHCLFISFRVVGNFQEFCCATWNSKLYLQFEDKGVSWMADISF